MGVYEVSRDHVNINKMNDKPIFISVLIIAYKRKEFLIDAIESVKNQTLDMKHYEVIVIKNYHDKTIDDWISKNNIKNIYSLNQTLGAKIAEALNYAKGNIISFLEDDDLFLNIKLEYVYNLFKDSEDLVFYHNAIEFIDDEGNLLNKKSTDPAFNLSSMSICKDILNDNLLNKMPTAVDTTIYFKALDSGKKIVYNDKILGYFREHLSQTHARGLLEDVIASKVKIAELYISSFQILYNTLSNQNVKNRLKNLILSFEMNLNLLCSIVNCSERHHTSKSNIIFWLMYHNCNVTNKNIIICIRTFCYKIPKLIFLLLPLFMKKKLIRYYFRSWLTE